MKSRIIRNETKGDIMENNQKKVLPNKVIGKQSEQGSEAWLQWRTKFKSASQASTVLGVNPFESADDMKRRALGLMPPVFFNNAMRTGVERENEVRGKTEKHFGKTFTPQCWEYGEYAASLDGMDEEGQIVVELKVSKYTYYKILKNEFPENYKIQVMQQLLCSGADIGYLVAMNPESGEIAISEKIVLEDTFYAQLEKAWSDYSDLKVS